jgi:hypothetical protein
MKKLCSCLAIGSLALVLAIPVAHAKEAKTSAAIQVNKQSGAPVDTERVAFDQVAAVQDQLGAIQKAEFKHAITAAEATAIEQLAATSGIVAKNVLTTAAHHDVRGAVDYKDTSTAASAFTYALAKAIPVAQQFAIS